MRLLWVTHVCYNVKIMVHGMVLHSHVQVEHFNIFVYTIIIRIWFALSLSIVSKCIELVIGSKLIICDTQILHNQYKYIVHLIDTKLARLIQFRFYIVINQGMDTNQMFIIQIIDITTMLLRFTKCVKQICCI